MSALLIEFKTAANSVLVSPAFLALNAPLVFTPTELLDYIKFIDY